MEARENLIHREEKKTLWGRPLNMSLLKCKTVTVAIRPVMCIGVGSDFASQNINCLRMGLGGFVLYADCDIISP